MANQKHRTKQPRITYQTIDEPDTLQIDAVFDRLFELVVAKRESKE